MKQLLVVIVRDQRGVPSKLVMKVSLSVGDPSDKEQRV